MDAYTYEQRLFFLCSYYLYSTKQPSTFGFRFLYKESGSNRLHVVHIYSVEMDVMNGCTCASNFSLNDNFASNLASLQKSRVFCMYVTCIDEMQFKTAKCKLNYLNFLVCWLNDSFCSSGKVYRCLHLHKCGVIRYCLIVQMKLHFIL